MKYDILIAGVGGQGTVLASRLLAAAAIENGYFARTAETIGMAQRGGCVVSHVRIGREEAGSLIPLGKADLLIGFEPSEAARNMVRLKPGGCCVVNTREIRPVTASLGGSACTPEAVCSYISDSTEKHLFIDGYSIAEAAGSVKALNIVLVGAAVAAGFLPMDVKTLEKTIISMVAPKYAEMNLKALDMGLNYIRY